MILTEEELKEIETIYGLHIDGGHRNYESIVKLIASHRNLLSTNAELSFKNQKLQEEIKELSSENYILREGESP